MHSEPTPTLSLRLPAVKAALGYTADGMVYRLINAGVMTPPCKNGKTSTWPAEEVRAVVAAVAGGASDDQRRALVRRLIAKRNAAWAALQNEMGLSA